MNEKKYIWDEFTGKYGLSKTLSFELEPTEKTRDFLKTNKVFERDQTIDNSYNQSKFYFDKLHQEFLKNTFSEENVVSLNFCKFAKSFDEKTKELIKIRKDLNIARKEKMNSNILQKKLIDAEDEMRKEKEELYKKIRILMDTEAEKWKKTYANKQLEGGKKIIFTKKEKKENKNLKGVGFLTSSSILQVLKYEFPASKDMEFISQGWPSLFVKADETLDNYGGKQYIFDSFDKFSGYLTKFQETRKNIYAENGITTAVSTRILSNLELFLVNKKTFESKYANSYKDIRGFKNTDIFNIKHYEKCLLQEGIESSEESGELGDSYNKIIGDLNKSIKEHRDQKESDAKKNKDKTFKRADYPLFKTLEKQILGEVQKERQLIEATENSTEEEVFLKRFREFAKLNEKHFDSAKKIMEKLFSSDDFIAEYGGIYVKNSSVNTISRRWFSDVYNFEKNLPQSSKTKAESDYIKIKKYISLADIKNSLDQLEGKPFKEDYYKKNIVDSTKSIWEQFLMIWKFEFSSLFKDVTKENNEVIHGYDFYFKLADKLSSFSKERKPEEIAIVKNYSDSSLRIFQMMKYVALDGYDIDKLSGVSGDFYSEMDEYIRNFPFNQYYNAFRNFVTKKPYDNDKIKLNFEKGTLLNGWAESPRGNAQYCGYILRKKDDYFLAVTEYTHFLDIEKYHLATKDYNSYEKLEYSSLDWGKNIAGGKVYASFTKTRYGESISYQDHKTILTKQQHVSLLKDIIKDKYVARFPELKAFIKQHFEDVLEMQKSFANLTLGGISFQNISGSWVDKQVIEEEGKKHELYLFRILNRDLRIKRTSSSNVHTLYWNALFSEENLEQQIFDILGNAEIFYRKASVGLKVRKNVKGEEYINKKGEKIVEGRRYSRDIISLHIPIALNSHKKSVKPGQFNKEINRYISKSYRDENVNVIGLDRGEKHLVYYSIVNPRGEIIDQGSLNKINGIDYYEKLITREKERLENRQSWNPVCKIKDLKRGYVSQVVRMIADLAVKHNAIIVMEDLNMRFKQIRGGIERSVYQQLEKQLIDKFGYLVFKNNKPEEGGNVLNGYQLSAPFDTFEKMGKQTGIIFYTQAEYTSITDPLSGFRKNIYISNSAPQIKIKEAVQKFDAIGWDNEFQSYYFQYDPSVFSDTNFVFAKRWTVYAKVPRIAREKDENGYWRYNSIDINQKFKELFQLWGFDNLEGDIWEQIQEKESAGSLKGEKVFGKKPRSFYHSFIYLFNHILQLRNSYSEQWVREEINEKICIKKIGENIDFIASPVKPFFSTYAINTKKEVLSPKNFSKFEKIIISQDKKRIEEEFNGDANGAYNIARKGIMLLEKIKKNPEKPELYISKTDWDEFVTKDTK